MTETGIVTPEAVVLAFDTAGVGSRMIAELLDLLVQAAAFGLAALGFAVLGTTPLGTAGVYVGLFLVMFGYPVASETLWRGKTVGKAIMGLRVVTVEGGQIRFRHALVRAAMSLVDIWFTVGGVAVLCILATPRNQRLGDLVAGTLVLRERTGARLPTAADFRVPPGWEQYASTLDVSGLTAADYQAARAFLLRAGSLPPMVRDRLARDIATPLLSRLRHLPPPGVPAEAFLVCIAARYQERQRHGAPAPRVGAPPPAPLVPPPAAWPVSPPADGGFAPPA